MSYSYLIVVLFLKLYIAKAYITTDKNWHNESTEEIFEIDDNQHEFMAMN